MGLGLGLARDGVGLGFKSHKYTHLHTHASLHTRAGVRIGCVVGVQMHGALYACTQCMSVCIYVIMYKCGCPGVHSLGRLRRRCDAPTFHRRLEFNLVTAINSEAFTGLTTYG